MAKTDRNELKMITPEFRGSFVTLNKPRRFGDQDPKYSITIVLPKDDPFWKKLQKKIKAAAEKRFEGKVPRGLKSPIRDGDDTEYDDWHGHNFAVAHSDERPGVVDKEGEDIIDKSELYSGAWFIAAIRPYGWHYRDANRKGVSLQLDNVMKRKDDEAFSGRSSATDDFADHIDGGGNDDDDGILG